MRLTCGTKLTKIKRLRRLLDFIRYGHVTHTCVQMSPLHVGQDHICTCGTKWPWIKLARKYS